MKNNITQKQLIDDGYEQFKFAGEYLFVGNAEIFIDKGDDDIIRFHDGKKYIRFIVSQKDLTFFFKGDLDMIRIGDKTEFDMKIVSERFSFKEDELLNILAEMLDIIDSLASDVTKIKDNAIQCCQTTNSNLEAILEAIKNLNVAEPPNPHVRVQLQNTGNNYQAVVSNFTELKERYGDDMKYVRVVNGVEYDGYMPPPVEGYNTIQLYIKGFKTETISNEVVYIHTEPHVRVELADTGVYEAHIANETALEERYGNTLKYKYVVNGVESEFFLPPAVEGENKIQVFIDGYKTETISNEVIVSVSSVSATFENLEYSGNSKVTGVLSTNNVSAVMLEIEHFITESDVIGVLDIDGQTYKVQMNDDTIPVLINNPGEISFTFYLQGNVVDSRAVLKIVEGGSGTITISK